MTICNIFCVYGYENLQDRLNSTKLDWCQFSVHLVSPSWRYLIKNFLNLVRSECLLIDSRVTFEPGCEGSIRALKENLIPYIGLTLVNSTSQKVFFGTFDINDIVQRENNIRTTCFCKNFLQIKLSRAFFQPVLHGEKPGKF